MLITDISKMLPQMLQKKLTDAETFYKNYKITDAGRFFEAYVDFFEKCKEAAI